MASNELYSPALLSVDCELCATRMQAVTDLLLLTSDLRPVNSESLSVFGESYSKCREIIIARSMGLTVFTRDIMNQLRSNRLKDVSDTLKDLTDVVIRIVECSSHAAYLAAITELGSVPALPGIIDKYKVTRAKVDIELASNRFHLTPLSELSPQVLVNISEELIKNLETLTHACKLASDASEDQFHKEQFRLSLKNVTACTSSLLSCIRRYKSTLDEQSRARCISFSKPLVQSCISLVDYATEAEHIGLPAELPDSSRRIQTAILGGCMSIASSCVRLCESVQMALYDIKNPESMKRLSVCCTAILDGSQLLSQALRDKASVRTLSSTPSSSPRSQSTETL
ncbi:talin rod domain-containing protein 1-like [Antedon mediterranea]|uniref:talin rod domain-containing protein 1-like n=1 Tax=Antedon mediterranea TaxID=105859 RepID=UPI003AF96F2F